MADDDLHISDQLVLDDTDDLENRRGLQRVDLDAEMQGGALQTEDPGAPVTIRLQDLQLAQEFVDFVRNATLDEEDLSDGLLERIRNPPCYPPEIQDDEDFILALRTWISPSAPEEAYERHRHNLKAHSCGIEIPSLAVLKSQVAELTGIVP